MPVDRELLETTTCAYASTMTSIRGRRVVKLLLREFASFDMVLPATAPDGPALVLALDQSGRAAVCATDGKGPTVAIDRAESPQAETVRTKYDFLKDSLPVVGREALAPGLSIPSRAVFVAAKGLTPAAKALVERLLPGHRWMPVRPDARTPP